MKILHVSCSPRGRASESYRLSRKIIGFLQRIEPAAVLVDRFIGNGTVPHVDQNYAVSLGAAREPLAESQQRGSMSRSEELIREVESSDVVVIGTPMHNLAVPSVLKAWIDHIVRVRRTFDVSREGKVGRLHDRPVFIAVSAGGVFSGEAARQPDFLTPYLKAILATIGLNDLRFFSIEGTAFGPDALAEAEARTDQALQTYFQPALRGKVPLAANDGTCGSFSLAKRFCGRAQKDCRRRLLRSATDSARPGSCSADRKLDSAHHQKAGG